MMQPANNLLFSITVKLSNSQWKQLYLLKSLCNLSLELEIKGVFILGVVDHLGVGVRQLFPVKE